MSRRKSGNMDGERYCGNTESLQFHDLDNEKSQCQVDEIITAGHDKPFSTKPAAEDAGYDPCDWCLPNG